MQKTPEIGAFWDTFKAGAGVTHNDYVVVAFGDNPTMQDELADLKGR